MSDDFSARLNLPYLAAGQMQKHVTLNAALSRLDALVQTAVISRSVSNQPATPADGDLYILPQAPVALPSASWSWPPGSSAASRAMAMSPMVACSPVLATTSSSRGSGSGWICLAWARNSSPLMRGIW